MTMHGLEGADPLQDGAQDPNSELAKVKQERELLKKEHTELRLKYVFVDAQLDLKDRLLKAKGLDQINENISTMRQEIASLKAENRDLKARKGELEGEMEPKKGALEAKNGEMKAKNGELEAKNVDLEAKNGELEAKKEELVAISGKLEATKGILEAITAELEVKNGELEAKTAELEAKNGELESKTAELGVKNAELGAKNGELERMKEKLRQLISEISGPLNEYDTWQETGKPHSDILFLGQFFIEGSSAQNDFMRRMGIQDFKELSRKNLPIENNRYGIQISPRHDAIRGLLQKNIARTMMELIGYEEKYKIPYCHPNVEPFAVEEGPLKGQMGLRLSKDTEAQVLGVYSGVVIRDGEQTKYDTEAQVPGVYLGVVCRDGEQTKYIPYGSRQQHNLYNWTMEPLPPVIRNNNNHNNNSEFFNEFSQGSQGEGEGKRVRGLDIDPIYAHMMGVPVTPFPLINDIRGPRDPNEPRGDLTEEELGKENVVVATVIIDGKWFAHLVVLIKDAKKGTELLVDYTNGYWDAYDDSNGELQLFNTARRIKQGLEQTLSGGHLAQFRPFVSPFEHLLDVSNRNYIVDGFNSPPSSFLLNAPVQPSSRAQPPPLIDPDSLHIFESQPQSPPQSESESESHSEDEDPNYKSQNAYFPPQSLRKTGHARAKRKNRHPSSTTKDLYGFSLNSPENTDDGMRSSGRSQSAPPPLRSEEEEEENSTHEPPRKFTKRPCLDGRQATTTKTATSGLAGGKKNSGKRPHADHDDPVSASKKRKPEEDDSQELFQENDPVSQSFQRRKDSVEGSVGSGQKSSNGSGSKGTPSRPVSLDELDDGDELPPAIDLTPRQPRKPFSENGTYPSSFFQLGGASATRPSSFRSSQNTSQGGVSTDILRPKISSSLTLNSTEISSGRPKTETPFSPSTISPRNISNLAGERVTPGSLGGVSLPGAQPSPNSMGVNGKTKKTKKKQIGGLSSKRGRKGGSKKEKTRDEQGENGRAGDGNGSGGGSNARNLGGAGGSGNDEKNELERENRKQAEDMSHRKTLGTGETTPPKENNEDIETIVIDSD